LDQLAATMRSPNLAVPLDAASPVPLFLQIARAVADDVRRGRLRPGDALPGSRTLADALGVHRNTVLAAYRELDAEGFIRTSAARATFVSHDLPEHAPRRLGAAARRDETPARPGFDLAPWRGAEPPPLPPGVLSMSGGVPDPRLVPTAALARAYRRTLRARGREVLAYGDPRGHERLRVALAEMLRARRGLDATADDIVVTRGSQMAIDLVARALVRPGDVVAVEALGYPPAWDALRLAGATLVPLPVDAAGLSIDALERLAGSRAVRAVYLTPHHQYPTTVTLGAGRRMALLDLARRHRIAVLEDDYDHEFHYEGRPVLPLASADRDGVVVHVGTLSKILAPGLRIGFVVAPRALAERLAALRRVVDRQGDQAIECAVAELVEDGELARHARRVRRIYAARRDALARALERHLGGVLSFAMPAGGMAVWARAPRGVDVDAWAARALERGVSVHPGRRFAFDGRPRRALRLAFAALDERELAEAVRRLAAAL
jgi:GntR family transcriptional regulator/MocR family aminotransferase